jgi:hypothetical protein
MCGIVDSVRYGDDDVKDNDTGFKAITKQKLLEILSDLPDDILISPMTNMRTNNLSIFKDNWPNEEPYGYIDLVDDTFERFGK